MSSTAAVAAHGAHAEHHELSFLRTYIFSEDHKMIGRQFLFMALFMMSIGGLMAMLMRLDLAWPDEQWKFLGYLPSFLQSDSAITPNIYNSMLTMHATIMIFFVVMPILVGWTSYAPLSAVPIYTGVDWGQDLWCISLIVLGASSLMGSINYITTIINMRTKGMYLFRMPLVIWSLFITAILLLLALPVLTTALALLLFDRMGGTHFFIPSGGGEPLLWQHLFWFFGHPEVYIMILPAMGITSIIGVPSAIKTFNWLGTLYKGNIHYTAAMLNALAFVAMFVIGGLSGIWMACTPVDMYIHDTYFIVAHIHYVLFGGSLFGIFAGITYWYPKMFGRMMNETLGKIHFWITFTAFNCTFFPMHILGMAGHMRRIYNPTQYEFLKPIQGINLFISMSAFVLGSAQFLFLANIVWSLIKGAKATENPWNANTLEWTTPSPPPHGNWPGTVPTVYRGPYEYSSPEVAEDFLPQSQLLEHETAAAD